MQQFLQPKMSRMHSGIKLCRTAHKSAQNNVNVSNLSNTVSGSVFYMVRPETAKLLFCNLFCSKVAMYCRMEISTADLSKVDSRDMLPMYTSLLLPFFISFQLLTIFWVTWHQAVSYLLVGKRGNIFHRTLLLLLLMIVIIILIRHTTCCTSCWIRFGILSDNVVNLRHRTNIGQSSNL